MSEEQIGLLLIGGDVLKFRAVRYSGLSTVLRRDGVYFMGAKVFHFQEWGRKMFRGFWETFCGRLCSCLVRPVFPGRKVNGVGDLLKQCYRFFGVLLDGLLRLLFP